MGRRHPQAVPEAPTLDAGALVAFDRGNRAIRVFVEGLIQRGALMVVPSAALAQAWCCGTRYALVAQARNGRAY